MVVEYNTATLKLPIRRDVKATTTVSRNGTYKKINQRGTAVISALAERLVKACFCLLLSQPTKVSAHRTGEQTMKV